jgi:hypothetical protein
MKTGFTPLVIFAAVLPLLVLIVSAIHLRRKIRYIASDAIRLRSYVVLRWVVAIILAYTFILMAVSTGQWLILVNLGFIALVPILVVDPYPFQRLTNPNTPEILFSNKFTDLRKYEELRKEWISSHQSPIPYSNEDSTKPKVG